jgi:hypothetical protein
LKKLSVAAMMAVKEKCIARQQAPHEGGNGSFAGANQKMHVIGHQSPVKARGRISVKIFSRRSRKSLWSTVSLKIFFSLYPLIIMWCKASGASIRAWRCMPCFIVNYHSNVNLLLNGCTLSSRSVSRCGMSDPRKICVMSPC